MSHPLQAIARRTLCLLAAVGLVAPAIADAAYRCRSAGIVIAAPCAQDERSASDGSGGCCPSDRDAGDDDRSGECCDPIPPEPSLAGAAQDFTPRPMHAFAPTPEPPGCAPLPHILRPPRVERPPGDALLFLEQCRFLC